MPGDEPARSERPSTRLRDLNATDALNLVQGLYK